LTLACAGLLKPRGSALWLLKTAFNAENFVRRLSWSMFRNFVAIYSWKCAAAKNCEKFSKNSYFGGSESFRSSMLVNLKSLSPVLVMISNMSVPICNRFHSRRANNGKMTSFWGGTPLWCPRSRRTPAPKGAKFCHVKLSVWGSSWWKLVIVACTLLMQITRVTDIRTDGRTSHG